MRSLTTQCPLSSDTLITLSGQALCNCMSSDMDPCQTEAAQQQGRIKTGAVQVRGRAIMMSYQASNVPKWVAEKLQSAITKNLTLPSCADIPLPYLLPVDHPGAGDALPGFLRALQGGAFPVAASC